MKQLIILFAITCSFIIAEPCQSIEISESDLKVISLALMAGIDYQQSSTMFYHMSNRRELNPLLSKKPSRESLMMFGVGGVLATYGITKVLPDGILKEIIIDSILMTEKLNIEENRRNINYGHRTFNTIMIMVHFNF